MTDNTVREWLSDASVAVPFDRLYTLYIQFLDSNRGWTEEQACNAAYAVALHEKQDATAKHKDAAA